MWRIWLFFDPRRAIVVMALFVITVVSANHFIQLSTSRYGSWLDGEPWPATASIEATEETLVADNR